MKPRRDIKTEAGFTLIEVMVSLAIVGLIMTMMFSGLSIGIDTWDRRSGKIAEIQSRARVERLLRRQLSLALPMEFDREEGAFVLFSGDRSKLEFVSPYSLIDGPAEARKIEYFVDGGRFIYDEHFMFDYDPDRIVDREGRQLGSFETVEFRYLGADRDGGPRWMEEWVLGSGLPGAVQIRVDDDYVVVPLVYR